MALATQSPSDVLASPLSRTVVEQTATQVFFPNHQAQWADYGEGFGLSAREFQLIRDELVPSSRRFLVRQGGRSVVCELDLSGLSDELSILSGRGAEVALAEKIRAQVGDDPSVWLPAFYAARQRKGAEGGSQQVKTQGDVR
jgi:type IV secretion system protein VirB4